jgi:hypothetical protein
MKKSALLVLAQERRQMRLEHPMHRTPPESRANGESALAVGRRPRGGALTVLRLTRAVGALALLAVGGVHIEQYMVAHFAVIPTIGPLFLVNFIAAMLFGLILLLPLGRNAKPLRLASNRW